MSRNLIVILLVFVFALGCSSSRRVTQDGETNWLRLCQRDDDCDDGLSCICGLCTELCESDDECNGLSADSQCVSAESFAEQVDCQENYQTEGGVCDLLCIDDDDCRAFDDDAICQSGSCRWQKLGRIPDAPNKDGGADDSNDSASEADSALNADALGVIDASLSSLSEADKKERRAQVISEYCALIEQYPCLDWEYSIVLPIDGSMEEQVAYCEMDVELMHYVAVFPACYPQWEAMYRCYIDYEWSCPCDAAQGECEAPTVNFGTPSGPCLQEQQAYDICSFWQQGEQNFDVEGERATCSGHIPANDSGNCDIQCDISSEYYYWAECEGPADGPVRCKCSLNRGRIYDVLTGIYDPIYASTCREATQAMADGICMDIINCCISWKDSNGYETCGCTADPSAGYYGMETGPTCQELADQIEGEVVDLCPENAPINWEALDIFPFERL